MEGDYFQSVHIAIGRKVLAEIRAVRRLRPTDAQAEIDVLRALAMTLTAAGGKMLPQEDVREAFIERSRMLVGAEFIASALAKAEDAPEEVRALVRIAENVTGPTNKRQAGQWLVGAVTALRFEKELREARDGDLVLIHADAGVAHADDGGAGVVERGRDDHLAGRAALMSRFGVGVGEADRQLIVRRLGDIGGLIEADPRLIDQILHSPTGPMQRLGLLLRLALGEAAPIGPAADRAKAAALKLAREPATRAELARAPEVLERLRPLMNAA